MDDSKDKRLDLVLEALALDIIQTHGPIENGIADSLKYRGIEARRKAIALELEKLLYVDVFHS